MYVCICNAVNETTLREAVSDGAQNVRDVRNSHGVGNQCGKCVCHAAEIIKQAKIDTNLMDQLATAV